MPRFPTLAVMACLAALPAAAVAGGAETLQSQCAGCHALAKPADAGLSHIWERKGPDLFYAGSKFQRDWLLQWLQNPTPIRPAGELYTRHVKAGDKHDVIDTASLAPHPKLAAADAAAVADALLTLTAPELVAKGAFKGEKVSPTMGAMFFSKLRGCGACHTAASTTGGQSGPELNTAGRRLQADFIYAYIKDPQKFDPHVWMPTLNLAEPDLQRLTGYLVQLNVPEAQP